LSRYPLFLRLLSSAALTRYAGINGNALALDDKEFEHFLTYTTGHEMKSMEKDGMLEKSSAPESLFGGEAGRAWTWAVADKGIEKRILGYNDL